MDKFSCYNCDKRCIGCHNNCLTYKLYKLNLEKIKERKAEAKQITSYRRSRKVYDR